MIPALCSVVVREHAINGSREIAVATHLRVCVFPQCSHIQIERVCVFCSFCFYTWSGVKMNWLSNLCDTFGIQTNTNHIGNIIFHEYTMMTSSNGNIFRISGPFTGHRWIPPQRPMTRSFDVLFDLRLNKQLSKQSWGWWFETQWCSLWRHCKRDAT